MGTFKQKFDDHHKLYIQKLEEGASDLEIKRELSWSYPQLRLTLPHCLGSRLTNTYDRDYFQNSIFHS